MKLNEVAFIFAQKGYTFGMRWQRVIYSKKSIEINDIMRVEVAYDDRELFLGWKLKLIIKATCVEQPFTSEISEFQKETHENRQTV